ncbi:TIGR02186 family protein [Pseudooceanicola algae]|uniref:Uncharacterized protein n=1 Tax=Pseudooceanicola algae TaxID=1537215 RepID=A0A418SKX7_9RHOB|nr:TIGR02186 family protein [Pseudooceanicola algae]QPM91005.1 hypothetical protein PSAL_022480 [Pseudooceanicola algae]
MTRLLVLLLSLVLLAPAARAQDEEVVLGLSQNRVSITTDFNGSEILIFGAIKRPGPPPEIPLEVIVTVRGPNEPVNVLRKDRVAGIWINTDKVEIRSTPSFYAVATSAPLEDSLTATEDLRHRISIPSAIRTVISDDTVMDEDSFVNALIRIREKAGTFQLLENSVRFDEQTLFSTSIALPSNLTVGVYRVEVFLTRQGQVVSDFSTGLRVGKVGLEQWLYTLAHDRAWIYAILAILIAVVSGWIASEAFRLLRRQ